MSESLDISTMLNQAIEKLAGEGWTNQDLHETASALSRFADQACETSQPIQAEAASLFASLVELAECSLTEGDQFRAGDWVRFVHNYLPVLTAESDETGELQSAIEEAKQNWGEYLELVGESSLDHWSPEENTERGPIADDTANEDCHVSSSQIEMLLSAVENAPANDHLTPTTNRETNSQKHEEEPNERPSDEAARQELMNDRELLDAYLDDAMRCLSSMEQSALEFESNRDSQSAVRQFCRELHTLKGASATVGLSGLAAYLHDLESSLDQVFSGESPSTEADPLFEAVDRVRHEMSQLQPQLETKTASDQPDHQSENFARVSTPELGSYAGNDDSSIRIRAAKLDRLMDMLAELVVLRNRRESSVSEFNLLNDELSGCASRLNLAEEQLSVESYLEPTPGLTPFTRNSSCTFSEVAKDISAVSQGLKELQKPVSQDNASISRFIRDFRQELMQLRRVPLSGMFNRLQRAARDAAKTENKQVRIEVVGDDTGLEQEIQERLFESLLHIVRNAVSHGIDTPEKRSAVKKDPIGCVTIEAFSNPQLLIIEVRDDGNGLNYDRVRQKAVDKGLIARHQSPTKEELANLIFHPGFSTRTEASEVSGRGVGMDIVAQTVRQLHGRVEIDSLPGAGTTMRLLIPLRTGIEHVMVFRCEGQLFALPMQSVTAAKSSNTNIASIARLSLRSAFSVSQKPTASEDVLILRQEEHRNRNSSDFRSPKRRQLALAVDEMIGPEEVVVRGLPNLLKNHPLFCGLTLAGSGETVLLLDSERVVEFCELARDIPTDEGQETLDTERRALVVDDSLTARKALVKLLHQFDFTTVEVGDGIEAIERLHRDQFDLVFTDLDMPRFGGMELLADIQSGQYCEAPVVVVSSRDEETFRSKAMDFGATDYINKPINEKSVTKLLESLQLLAINS
jgi:chemosensory pili system protein ChpA (sensor histidine kinase/response regulator)